MTVLEAIQRSAEFLTRKGVDSPRLQAELLLAHQLRIARMQLYLNFERVLTGPEVDGLREMIKRRGQREPLQQIIGLTSFCGLDIAVSRHVLVPRAETELLAEAGWTFLEEHGEAKQTTVRVLDFGTGSGCLAVVLAAKCPGIEIHALDVSAEALAVARANAARHQVADRIQFVQGESLSALPADIKFSLVISNPPYIPSGEVEALEPEVRDHEPREALDGGPGGLEIQRQLASEAGSRIAPGGRLMVEFGDGQAEAVREIYDEQKWIVERIIEDYTHRPRVMIARRTTA